MQMNQLYEYKVYNISPTNIHYNNNNMILQDSTEKEVI